TLFGKIWDEVVGMNPRKEAYAQWTPETEFVQQVRRAQWRVWVQQTYTPQPRPLLPREEGRWLYQLDPSWLAGLVGPIEVRVGHTTALVVLRTDDIYGLTAVKRPSRDKRDAPELTEEEKEAALHQARIKLSQGIPLQVPASLNALVGSMVVLEDDIYYLQQGNRTRSVDEAFTFDMPLPLHPFMELSIDTA